MKYSQFFGWSLAAFSTTWGIASPAHTSTAAAAPAVSSSPPSPADVTAAAASDWMGRSPTVLTPKAAIAPTSKKAAIAPLPQGFAAAPELFSPIAHYNAPPEALAPVTLAAAETVTPLAAAAPLAIVELVEPGTGDAWLPAQSASALAGPTADLAQITLSPQPTSGWYVSLAPEVVFGYDIAAAGGELTVPVAPAPGLPPFTTTTVPLEASIDTDRGFGVSGAVGYRFDHARVELELGYNSNDVDRLTVNDFETSVDGSIDNWQFLLNGYYDFPTGSRFRPYVGGGAGLAIVAANDVSATVPQLGEVSIDDSNSSFLFQFKAGVGYDVTDTLNAFLGYRLMGIPGQSFEVLDTDLDADTLFIHSLQLGARYEF